MTLLWCMLAVATGQLVKGVTGFGSMLVAIPLMGLVLDPAEAIFLALASDAVVGLLLAWSARADVRWWAVVALLPTMAIGQWIGTGLLGVLPPATVRRLLAGVVALLAVTSARGACGWPGAEAARTPAVYAGAGVAGLAGGVMAGLVGMPGPPVVAWVRRVLPDLAGRAVLLAVFVPASVGTCALLLGRGLVAPSRLEEAAWLVPASIAGGALGTWIGRRLSAAAFARVVAALLLGAALALATG